MSLGKYTTRRPCLNLQHQDPKGSHMTTTKMCERFLRLIYISICLLCVQVYIWKLLLHLISWQKRSGIDLHHIVVVMVCEYLTVTALQQGSERSQLYLSTAQSLSCSFMSSASLHQAFMSSLAAAVQFSKALHF